MKIIQANIWQGKLGQQIIQFLQKQNPDIVCMQEVNDLKGSAGYKLFATLDEIKEASGFKEAIMSASYSSRYMERELEYGNAILSKLPVIDSKTIFTRGEYRRHFDITHNDGNTRNLQSVTLDAGSSKLTVFNHHGHRIKGTKAGDDETLRQMQIIADEIDKTDGPVIMCGDFNLAPHSNSLQLINDRLTNLSVLNGLKSTYNQFSENNVVCDYIFVSDQVKVERFEMSEELISDHKALILEFDLT